ncbi:MULTISPECIES: YaaA family protein [Campylobacter]|uniref:YaaA family protein n=1 Tax=Campylobacter TaxID=194 RepID=UPI0014753715|nr:MULTISPECIES: YaaA family protein [unclassified Campylobacter]MBE3609215.1 YaaA family protein [Campylobacter sp. RM12916]
MKILFSPSESKSAFNNDERLDKSSLVFLDLYEKRLEILNIYNEFIKTSSIDKISKLFGIKNLIDDKSLRQDVFTKGLIKAVLRYDGVAYKHLNYRDLSQNSQNYIDKNVVIFSNLFGPILAGDKIFEYKLKQGEKINGVNIEKFYNEHFSKSLDEFLQDNDILDLRAGYYEKFYQVKKEHTSFKFIKNGKIVSHHAKAYRGKILNQIAKDNINSKKELMDVNFDGLKLVEIKKIGLKNEVCFEIMC